MRVRNDYMICARCNKGPFLVTDPSAVLRYKSSTGSKNRNYILCGECEKSFKSWFSLGKIIEEERKRKENGEEVN